MKFAMRGLLALFLALSMAGAAMAADKAIIVLDASGSMWGQIGGKPKLEIARETLRTVLQSVPADLELGLMAYGHREKGNCQDIQLIVPPAAGTGAAISDAADHLQFLGKTPLTAAVEQAADDLKYTEDKATVILITDGIETCDADPCAVGRKLEESGVDFTAHVVGFGLTADEGRQVACLAESTGGKYIQASDEKALQEALVETVVAPQPEPAPEPAPQPARPEFNFMPTVVMAEGGDPIVSGNAWEIYKAGSDGSRGDSVSTEYDAYKGNLEAGDYVVVARLGEAEVEQKVTIDPSGVATPVFILDAGTIVIRPRPSEGAEVSEAASVFVEYPGDSTTSYGETRLVVPAGEQKVTVKIGEGQAVVNFPVKAGETVEKDVVVGVGHVVMNAFYTQGGERVENGGLTFEVLEAKTRLDGSRNVLLTSYGEDSKADLPGGDYVLVARMDKASVEQPFTVKPGEAVKVDAVLNAGVLAISAPGAYSIEIFAAKKDLQGNRKSIGFNYGEAWQQTMPAGDYAVVKTMPNDGGTRDGAATVKAGERTEVTVE